MHLVEPCPGDTWTGTEVYGRAEHAGTRIASAGFERDGRVFGLTWNDDRITRADLPVSAPNDVAPGPRCSFSAVLAAAAAEGFDLATPFHVRFASGTRGGVLAASWTLTRSLGTERVAVDDACP